MFNFEIRIGDYVNGYKVEGMAEISGEIHYLVTYYCEKHRKAQSKYIPESKVLNVCKRERFNLSCIKVE